MTRTATIWQRLPLPASDHVSALAELISAGGVVVLSGAGLSTESGIPDYRGPTGLARGGTPMQYAEFVGSDEARKRYWARSHLGWHTIAKAHPNAGHRAVAALERLGVIRATITQNVDGLHQAAGSTHVVNLHGRLDRVTCLGCGDLSTREVLQQRLLAANVGWVGEAEQVRPDGDAVVSHDAIKSFTIVSCSRCDGLLKPDVVFFGESVPRPRVDECYDLVDEADSLVVLGSSLTVMSGLRFVRHAAKVGVPIAIVNQGETRGDALASVRVDAPLGETLENVRAQTLPQRLQLGHST